MKIPFSVYDFFAYLATGFIVLAAADYAFDGGWLQKSDVAPGILLVLVVAAYIIGHAVAHLSSAVLEQWFLRKVLKAPEETLFKDSATGFWSYVFPAFYKPFPHETQQRVLDRARAAGITQPGRGLFFHCFAVVKRDKSTAERLATFLNVYGFCRNACMAALLAALLLLFVGVRDVDWSTRTNLHAEKLWWAAASLVVAMVLLFRYLKFFKHYTQEVFRDYAERPGVISGAPPPVGSGARGLPVEEPDSGDDGVEVDEEVDSETGEPS